MRENKETSRKTVVTAIILAMMLITTLSSVLAATDYMTTAVSNGARLRVSLINQNPDPAEPGKYVEIRFKVENLGSESANDVTFELLPNYPFSLDDEKTAIKDLGNLQGRQYDDEGVILYYKVRVDDNAVEGSNDIVLRYKTGKNGEWVTLDNFPVRIQTIDAALSVESVKTTPQEIPPGGKAEVEIVIKNLADSMMKDITVKLDLTLAALAASSAMNARDIWEALPFAPVDSISEKRIKQLKPGETSTLKFNLLTYPKAIATVYKVPIMITFYDELEKQYTKTDVIGMTVGSKPMLEVDADSDNIYGKGVGDATVKFVNRGLSDIKFLYVSVKETEDYSLVSASDLYVGGVDSDDYQSADFKINVRSGKKTLEMPIHIEYTDANNNEFKEDRTVPLHIYTAEERGVKQGNGVTTIVIVAIVLVFGWFAYRRWEKKRKNGKTAAK